MSGSGPSGPPSTGPDEEALRDGVPLDVRRHADPRLVAAERVIAQLRRLLGAVAVQAGGTVDVGMEALTDRAAGTVRLSDRPDGGVSITVRSAGEPPEPVEAAEPPERALTTDARRRPGRSVRDREPTRIANTALMQRVQDILAAHASQPADGPEPGEDRPASGGTGGQNGRAPD